MKPKRLQRSRKKGYKKPEGSIIVDRTSKWGNPFKVGTVFYQPLTLALMGFKGAVLKTGIKVKDNKHAVELYEKLLTIKTKRALKETLEPLRGKDLVCFCKLDEPCHADVLLKLANNGVK